MVRLAMTGPHSSGKTTLLNALRPHLDELGIVVLPEITRIIKQQGYSINEQGDLDTQQLVMSTHIQNLLMNSWFIVDRCLLDGVIYTEYLHESESGPLPNWFVTYCNQTLLRYLPAYDIVFYLPAEIPVADDGVRSTSQEFHTAISAWFEKKIQHLRGRLSVGRNIIDVRGSVEERTQTVLKAIKEKT